MQNRGAEYGKAAEVIQSIINKTSRGYIGMPKENNFLDTPSIHTYAYTNETRSK